MSVDANTLAHLAKLVESALDDVDNAAVRGSVVLRKAVRVARLREDWEDVWWLRLQSINPKEQKTEYDELRAELTRYLPADDWDATSGRVFNKWLALREREDGNVQAMPLHDLEAHVDGLAAAVNRLEDPPFDLTTGVVGFRKVEARIREAIATYLADVERQLLSGRLHSTAFPEFHSL